MDKKVVGLLKINADQILDDTVSLRDSIKDYNSIVNMVTTERKLHEQFNEVEDNLSEASYYLERAQKILKETMEGMI
jgi:transcriptional regulator with GAF, ATPase, and Fis domain